MFEMISNTSQKLVEANLSSILAEHNNSIIIEKLVILKI
jgi:hypothetical protein